MRLLTVILGVRFATFVHTLQLCPVPDEVREPLNIPKEKHFERDHDVLLYLDGLCKTRHVPTPPKRNRRHLNRLVVKTTQQRCSAGASDGSGDSSAISMTSGPDIAGSINSLLQRDSVVSDGLDMGDSSMFLGAGSSSISGESGIAHYFDSSANLYPKQSLDNTGNQGVLENADNPANLGTPDETSLTQQFDASGNLYAAQDLNPMEDPGILEHPGSLVEAPRPLVVADWFYYEKPECPRGLWPVCCWGELKDGTLERCTNCCMVPLSCLVFEVQSPPRHASRHCCIPGSCILTCVCT